MRYLLMVIAAMLAVEPVGVAGTQPGGLMQLGGCKDSPTYTLSEGEHTVLRYVYHTQQVPKDFFDDIPENHKAYATRYAVPRSDYIHPLYGPQGQVLTADWNKDHPHHRGIYWAWPEVMYKGQLGDLHALQKVWARPTGVVKMKTANSGGGDDYVGLQTENRWMWEDKTPIVDEVATIKAWRATGEGRYVDLEFTFTALEDGVSLARRGTRAYGGLNIRLAPVQNLKLTHYADREDAQPQMAWQSASGVWKGSDKPTVLTVFESKDNPSYPGQYVEYANLPWFQPTFPRQGVRHELKKGEPLTLKYRLWVRLGAPPTVQEYRRQWAKYNEQTTQGSKKEQPWHQMKK